MTISASARARMTGAEYVRNPNACPYCHSADTRAARHAIGRACNACSGIWSNVYRGTALVGFDPHAQQDAAARQTHRPTAPYVPEHVPAVPAQVQPRGPALSLDSIGDAVADLMRD
jgi:hypothetical protein